MRKIMMNRHPRYVLAGSFSNSERQHSDAGMFSLTASWCVSWCGRSHTSIAW